MPPKQQNKEEKSMQKALKDVEEATEEVKQFCYPELKTKSGKFVALEEVKEGNLICFKTDDDKIMCGFAILCKTDCVSVTVVLKKRKRRTTMASRKVWLAKDTPMTEMSLDHTFKDKEFDDDAFKKNSKEKMEEIGQEKVKSKTCIHFTDKEGTMYCGYAYKNGSNMRVVCKDRAKEVVTSKTVWRSDSVTTTQRHPDTFVDADFDYTEEEVIKEAIDFFDCKVIIDKIHEMQVRHDDKKP